MPFLEGSKAACEYYTTVSTYTTYVECWSFLCHGGKAFSPPWRQLRVSDRVSIRGINSTPTQRKQNTCSFKLKPAVDCSYQGICLMTRVFEAPKASGWNQVGPSRRLPPQVSVITRAPCDNVVGRPEDMLPSSPWPSKHAVSSPRFRAPHLFKWCTIPGISCKITRTVYQREMAILIVIVIVPAVKGASSPALFPDQSATNSA